MAILPESMALSCPSRLRICVQPPATSSTAISFSVGRKLDSLPGFTGLKFHSPLNSSAASLSARTSKVSRQSGRVVCEVQQTAFDIPVVTDATWKALVLKADGPVLVEFWAPWCGPCRMIHPVIGELANQFGGKLQCYQLNTDDSPSIATQYGIRSVPTIMIFVNGEKKDAVIGAVPKTTLTASIEKFL